MKPAIPIIEDLSAVRRRHKRPKTANTERGRQFSLRGMLAFTAAISSLFAILHGLNVDGTTLVTAFLLCGAVGICGAALVELSWHLQGGPASVDRWRRMR